MHCAPRNKWGGERLVQICHYMDHQTKPGKKAYCFDSKSIIVCGSVNVYGNLLLIAMVQYVHAIASIAHIFFVIRYLDIS